MSNIWEELEHHGIMGMKWGIRRYQPYPKGEKQKGKFLGKGKKVSTGTSKKKNIAVEGKGKKVSTGTSKKKKIAVDAALDFAKAKQTFSSNEAALAVAGTKQIIKAIKRATDGTNTKKNISKKEMEKADKKWNDQGAKPIKKHIKQQQKEIDKIVERHVKAIKGEATTKHTQALLKEVYDHMNKTALAQEFSKSPSGTKVMEFNPVIVGDQLLFKVVEKPIKQKKKTSTIKHSIQNGNINNQEIVDSILRKHGLERRY